MDYLSITFDVIGYALLLITIYCCYEAYYKIKRNKGYIYIAIICFIFPLPSVIKFVSSMFIHHEVKVEYPTRRTSNTEISPLVVSRNIPVNLPLIELFLLLAVLNFTFKDKKNDPNQEATGNPASPDTRA